MGRSKEIIDAAVAATGQGVAEALSGASMAGAPATLAVLCSHALKGLKMLKWAMAKIPGQVRGFVMEPPATHRVVSAYVQSITYITACQQTCACVT